LFRFARLTARTRSPGGEGWLRVAPYSGSRLGGRAAGPARRAARGGAGTVGITDGINAVGGVQVEGNQPESSDNPVVIPRAPARSEVDALKGPWRRRCDVVWNRALIVGLEQKPESVNQGLFVT